MATIQERLNKAREEINHSLTLMFRNISAISLENLEDGTMNPYLIKGLGMPSVGDAIEFYVWQRVGRSVTTSFGSLFEKVIRIMTETEKGEWWDLVKETGEHASIKSGPRDMDKDQVIHFAREAKKLLAENKNAKALLILAYGKVPFGLISKYLKSEGLKPDETLIVGLKSVFKIFCNDPSLADKIIKILDEECKKVNGGNNLIKVINSKIKELKEEANKKYKNIDDLVKDLIGIK